ncbi:hypothetical protein JXR01_01290 [Candidatus Kaiserbacteria bacterium]|nr:MAG: hypothetical protein JXR01_01290 [Candidatus Kaiserbacteria bacterium]
MKRHLTYILLATALLIVPLGVFAQGIVPCNGPDCDWGSLVTLGQNILNLIVSIAVISSAVMFAYAGWLFFSDTGNASNVEKGKKIFGAVVIGLIIVLVAWLVVNTILVTLTGRGLEERTKQDLSEPFLPG